MQPVNVSRDSARQSTEDRIHDRSIPPGKALMSHFTLLRSSAPKLTTRRAKRSPGQSLVEFALVLPVILLLTLIALDFGRIYLGYINLQSMARIAANFASNNPDAWGATPDAAVQAKYKNQ